MQILWELGGLAAGVLLGTASVLTRAALRFENPIKAVWFVALGGMISLAPWALPAFVAHSGDAAWMRGLLFFLAAGVMGPVVGRIFLFESMARLGPSMATAFKTAVPFLTAIAARLLFKETVGWLGALGIGVVIGGLLVLIGFQETPYGGNPGRAGGHQRRAPEGGRQVAAAVEEERHGAGRGRLAALWSAGIGIGVACALAYSVTDLFRRAAMDALPSPVVGTWIGNVAATLVLTVYFAGQGRGRDLLRWDRRSVPILLAATVLITVAYIVFLVGVAHSGVSITSALAAIEPLAALTVGKLFFRSGETLQLRQVPGLIMVIIGVALILLRGG